jgi:RNA polymerase sigma-B factor
MVHAAAMTEVFSELDDLDCAASEYAFALTVSDAEHRRLLREDLIRRLVPFADRLASRYGGCIEPLEDIRQVARLGLVNAVDRYDPERGSFTAFAVVTMTGEVKRHFRDRTWAVHVNRGLQDLSTEVGHATAELTQTLSRTPTAPEIARHLKVGEHDVRSARMCTAGRTPMSLNTPLGDDGSRELGDLIGSPDETLENIADRLALEELVRELPPQIQGLMIMRFYGNLTQSQIAAEFGISQAHVSRLLRRGLAWLRAALLSDAPPPWSRVYQCYDLETTKVRMRETDTSIEVQVVPLGIAGAAPAGPPGAASDRERHHHPVIDPPPAPVQRGADLDHLPHGTTARDVQEVVHPVSVRTASGAANRGHPRAEPPERAPAPAYRVLGCSPAPAPESCRLRI